MNSRFLLFHLSNTHIKPLHKTDAYEPFVTFFLQKVDFVNILLETFIYRNRLDFLSVSNLLSPKCIGLFSNSSLQR